MPGSPQITSGGQKVTKRSKVSICCAGSADFLGITWVHQLEEVEKQLAEQPAGKLQAGAKSWKRISDLKTLPPHHTKQYLHLQTECEQIHLLRMFFCHEIGKQKLPSLLTSIQSVETAGES